jgi:hypothetical protein
MKNRWFLILAAAFIAASSSPGLAAPPVSAVIAPYSSERVTIASGERGVVTVGLKEGIIKGDIGWVTPDAGGAPYAAIARCAVTHSDYQSSVVETIEAGREIDAGMPIFFDRVVPADPTLYPVTIGVLSAVVQPYAPYRHLRVCLYGFFNDKDAVTGLSEAVTREFAGVFAQKKRLTVLPRSALKDLVFYPARTPAPCASSRRTCGRPT